MNTKEGKKIVESSAGGHIDVAYGIFDRPGPDITNEEIPEFSPIVPLEQVSTQLTVERPPVDDPEFTPTGRRELEASAAELAKMVPDDMSSKFYKRVHDLVEEMLDDEETTVTQLAGEEVMESVLQKKLARMINEVIDGEEMQKQFEEEFGTTYEEESSSSDPEGVVYGDASLEDIAKATGFSGPSGAKNFISKLLSRVKRFSGIPNEEFDALVEFAAGEYIDLLEASDLIDASDAEYMSRNKNVVSKLPSFKYFIFNALVLPAVKHLERESKKETQKYLNKLGMPQRVQDTVMNQLMGLVPRNDDLIQSRLADAATSGDMTPQMAKDAADKLSAAFTALQKIAQAGDNFVEIALQKYSSLSKGKLLDIMKKASEDPYVAEAM
jgi:AcrR family transcriptional regulator